MSKSLYFGRINLHYAEGDNEYTIGKKGYSHCHDALEITYMIDGKGDYNIEGKKLYLVTDSLLLIPANYFHQWENPEDKIHYCISLHFPLEIFYKRERDFYLGIFNEPAIILNVFSNKINFYIQAIADCGQFEETLQEMAAKIRLESLLYQIHLMKTANSVKPLVLDERIRDVIVYIGEHLSEELTLDSVACKFALHKDHLNVLFHEIVGTPIMKYVKTKRLGFAHQEILSGCRPREASLKAGFNDYTTFFRAYKLFYGRAPTEALVSGKELSLLE